MKIFQCHCTSELPNTRTTFGVKYDGTEKSANEIIDWIKSYRNVCVKINTVNEELVIQFQDKGRYYTVGKDDYLLYTPKNIFLDCDNNLFKNNFKIIS